MVGKWHYTEKKRERESFVTSAEAFSKSKKKGNKMKLGPVSTWAFL
jgi:hypothetical protein